MYVRPTYSPCSYMRHHCMFHQAMLTLGDAASFEELALQINQQSVIQQGQPTLQLDKYKIWRWFKEKKGKLQWRITRPCLTEAHKQERLTFCEQMQGNDNEPHFYGDKKWFLEESGWKSLKHLPHAEIKAEGADRLQVRRVISRSHPMKWCLWELWGNQTMSKILMVRFRWCE